MKAQGSAGKAGARVDLRRSADTGERLHGRLPGAGLSRLSQDVLRTPGDVDWSAQASWRPVAGGAPQLWLHLHCRSDLAMTCQRCLQPTELVLEVDRALRFVRDEAEAERLDEDSIDDMLAMPVGGILDLPALIEDELILALPLVPRHEVCPQPLMPPSALADPAPTQRPFEALAVLKRKAGGGPSGAA